MKLFDILYESRASKFADIKGDIENLNLKDLFSYFGEKGINLKLIPMDQEAELEAISGAFNYSTRTLTLRLNGEYGSYTQLADIKHSFHIIRHELGHSKQNIEDGRDLHSGEIKTPLDSVKYTTSKFENTQQAADVAHNLSAFDMTPHEMVELIKKANGLGNEKASYVDNYIAKKPYHENGNDSKRMSIRVLRGVILGAASVLEKNGDDKEAVAKIKQFNRMVLKQYKKISAYERNDRT